MATAAAADDNMIPGQTYTFKFLLGNIVTSPSTSTLQSDLQSNAPDFVNNSLIVTNEGGSALHWLTNIYDVQFTYNGDGTDVISDVANLIVSAIKSGSNDDFTFQNAYADSAANIGSSGTVADTVKQTLDQTMGTITDAVSQATKQASKSAQDILTPVEVAVAIVVGLVVLLIFTSGKSGGLSAGAEGVNIGGYK